MELKSLALLVFGLTILFSFFAVGVVAVSKKTDHIFWVFIPIMILAGASFILLIGMLFIPPTTTEEQVEVINERRCRLVQDCGDNSVVFTSDGFVFAYYDDTKVIAVWTSEAELAEGCDFSDVLYVVVSDVKIRYTEKWLFITNRYTEDGQKYRFE